MRLEEMLLFYSFAQIKGVSERKERGYWAAGETLNSLADRQNMQLSFFDSNSVNKNSDVQSSIDAILYGNLNFFQHNLDRKYYYRIAYSFPNDIMFLDIETTGLSKIYHYVTCVGWVMNGKYKCWLQGTDPQPFLEAFKSAKMIITFNGTRFDCKFLDQVFHTNEFSKKINLDLMTLCRRFKLKGGQKIVEKKIGFTRPQRLGKTDGKEAIALWYSFLFGQQEALNQLIEYNYYDILGMVYILDWIFYKKIYGKEFPKVGKPKRFSNSIYGTNISCCFPSSDICDGICTFIKENISNFSKECLKQARPYRIVGIDLAGKVERRTGLCLLEGDYAETKVAHTDEDIIKFIMETQPDLISIDAPLSLPNGRVSVYDNDPARKTAGIIRYCERELKHRGINSYPALIKSMQELTKRGIFLAMNFRKKGYPVIECFPGAAQDIIQLPRKRTDESLLKQGLIRFGINGAFQKQSICHDELDAITASLVGQFFIAGFYESLGIPEENDMIIPQKNHRPASHHLVIGIAGPVAAGKTTISKYLEKNGYHYIRYSQIIEQELKSNGYATNRDVIRSAGAAIYHDNKQYNLNTKLYNYIDLYPIVVIDGMRHYEDYTFWKEKCFLNFIMIYIDAAYDLRRKRFGERGIESIEYERAVSHLAEEDVYSLKTKADYIIENNSTLEKLYISVENVLSKIAIIE